MRWGNDSWLRQILQFISGMKRPRRWKSGGRVRLPTWQPRPRVKRARWHSSASAKRQPAAHPFLHAHPTSARNASIQGQGYPSMEWKSKLANPNRKRWLWLILLLIFSIMSVQMFLYVDEHLRSPLMHLAKIRLKQMATQAINKAISEQITNGRPMEELIQWKMDNDGKVSSFILNSNEHMRITAETVMVVQDALHEVEEFRDDIPLGQALGSTLIASFGPRIPVHMEPQGAVKVDLSTRANEVAINMVLVEVYIKVVEEIAIVIPFASELEIVETEIPISYMLVVGDVPLYYYDSKGNPVGDNRDQAPAITLPPLTTSDDSKLSQDISTHSNSALDEPVAGAPIEDPEADNGEEALP